MDFEYNSNPGRVIFGRGTIKKLPAELERQKFHAPLILSTPEQISQANDLKTILNNKVAGVFNNATMHTPTNITDEAVNYASSQGADCVVSIGGGSTTGLGKAISIRTGLPHISIPTTYAGSEMTPILGETADGVKKTRSDPKILPGTVIYDVDLTMTLPVGMSAVSGVNAIAHAGKNFCFSFWGGQKETPSHLRMVCSFIDECFLLTHVTNSRGAICPQHQPHHQPPRTRRHQSPRHRSPSTHHGPVFRGSPLLCPLRRLALRHLSRQRRHEPAPQALPHPRWQL